jgi:hypothetical protein
VTDAHLTDLGEAQAPQPRCDAQRAHPQLSVGGPLKLAEGDGAPTALGGDATHGSRAEGGSRCVRVRDVLKQR